MDMTDTCYNPYYNVSVQAHHNMYVFYAFFISFTTFTTIFLTCVNKNFFLKSPGIYYDSEDEREYFKGKQSDEINIIEISEDKEDYIPSSEEDEEEEDDEEEDEDDEEEDKDYIPSSEEDEEYEEEYSSSDDEIEYEDEEEYDEEISNDEEDEEDKDYVEEEEEEECITEEELREFSEKYAKYFFDNL